MVGDKIIKPQNRMTHQVFYLDMRMSREVLAAEWDKKLFLTSLEEAGTLFRIEFYAFCVLDDRIRLLAGGTDVRRRTLMKMLSAALEHYERGMELNGEKGILPSETVFRVKTVRMECEQDAVSVLRYIHLTPLSEGYTISAQDYWWTSYNSYRGFYRWPMVNTEPVMQFLSRSDARAAHTLAEYHSRGVLLRNPVPECIRDGEYETLRLCTLAVLQGNIN